jgi:hypothetical protein
VTTEDEVMRLLRRADPDRDRADAPAVDGADYLAALRTRSATVTLIDTEPTPTRPERRHRWPMIAVAAAAVAAIVVGGLVIVTRNGDPTGVVPAAQPSTVVPVVPEVAPVEFTACVGPGPSVTPGPEENVTASLPDGETRLTRRRGGYTWQSMVSGVSDPRLEGTWYNSVDKDEYILPGGVVGPNFYAVTHRVENDEGAWQGSLLSMEFPDGDSVDGPIVLTGEGAYEGLSAVAAINFYGACPNTRGYIIEGGVPAPPVPQTGQ